MSDQIKAALITSCFSLIVGSIGTLGIQKVVLVNSGPVATSANEYQSAYDSLLDNYQSLEIKNKELQETIQLQQDIIQQQTVLVDEPLQVSALMPGQTEDPLSMRRLETFTSDGDEFEWTDEWRDNTDSFHHDVLAFYTGQFNYENGFVSYLVDKKYTSITGTFALSFNSRDNDNEAVFKIWGDGKLLYKSPAMTGGVLPASFNVDITNVDEIKIGVERDSMISLGLTDLYLHK